MKALFISFIIINLIFIVVGFETIAERIELLKKKWVQKNIIFYLILYRFLFILFLFISILIFIIPYFDAWCKMILNLTR